MKSSSQVSRLLTLIPYLQRHPGARMTDVADAFDIAPEQLRRDLAVLWMCGLPGLLPGDLIEIDMDAVEHEGVIHLSNADYLSRPVTLSAAEALTLVVGLQSLLHVAGPDAATAITGALDKLRAALGARGRLADQVVIDIHSAADRVRQTLEQAIAEQYRVELEYQREDELEGQRRSADPHAVVLRDGYAYLEAWDCDRQGWRSFRLDRINAAVMTSIPARDHGAPPPVTGHSWLAQHPDAQTVEVWLAAEARWVIESYPVEAVRPATSDEAATVGRKAHPDDVVATILIADPRWLTRLLLRLGASARVLDPPAVADEARQQAAAALRMHAELSR